MPTQIFTTFFTTENLKKKKKKKKSCHLSNNYNKVTKRLKWFISKFRLKPNVCFYSIAIIMIIVIFFFRNKYTHEGEDMGF